MYLNTGEEQTLQDIYWHASPYSSWYQYSSQGAVRPTDSAVMCISVDVPAPILVTCSGCPVVRVLLSGTGS